MDRYHELMGTGPTADASANSDDNPWNDADRWARRAIALRSAGRFDEWAACFDEDVVWTSHRSLTGRTYRGRAEVSHAYSDQPVSMTAETLGVRRRLVGAAATRVDLPRSTVRVRVPCSPAGAPAASLTEAAVYDLDDLHAAFEQLDEWYIEELPPIAAAHLRLVTTFLGAMNDRDLDRASRAYLAGFCVRSSPSAQLGPSRT